MSDRFELTMLPKGGVLSIDTMREEQVRKLLKAPFLSRVKDKAVCSLLWLSLGIQVKPDPRPVVLGRSDVLVVALLENSSENETDELSPVKLQYFIINVGGIIKTGFLHRELATLSRMLEWERLGLAVWRRQSGNKKPTFAIGADGDGKRFPVFLTYSMPMRDLRQVIKIAIRGARVARRLDRRVEWEELIAWGATCSPIEQEVPRGAVASRGNLLSRAQLPSSINAKIRVGNQEE